MERRSAVSLFTASAAVMVLTVGLIWVVVALFGGAEAAGLFSGTISLFMVAVTLVAFLVNHRLLRKGRRALLILLADLALDAAAAFAMRLIFGTDAKVLLISCAAALIMAQIFQVRWEVGRFRDSAMLIQMQVLFFSAVAQIWMGQQVDARPEWIAVTFFAIIMLLIGLAMSKLSGLQPAGGGSRGRGNRIAVTCVSAGAVAAAAAVIGIFAAPVGNAFIFAYEHLRGIFASIMTAVGRVIAFFSGRNRMRMDEYDSASSTSDAAGSAASGGIAGGSADIFRIIFGIIAVLLVAALIFIVVRLLLRLTIRARHDAGGRSGRVEEELSLWERIRRFFAMIRRRRRARALLRRNRDSAGALLVLLEKRCRKHGDLKRKKGETSREFLTRLSETADENDQLSLALLRLADAVDIGFYAPGGDLLASFAEGSVIRSFDAGGLLHKNS